MTVDPLGVTRVLLVDDHVILREGLREILDAEDDVVVVGEAGSSDHAVALVQQHRPDVVVLDVDIPGDSVTATVIRILQLAPSTRVLILSVFDQPMVVRELLDIGIRGYLLKSVGRHDFVAAVRGVHRDDERIILSISRESLRQVNGAAPGALSARERQIMELVADAMSNAQIARRLSITEGTVKRHLRNIFAKLAAVSRIDAVNKAIASQQLPSRKG
jgi:DNA-binding NarL/FixJ family response regulator